MTEPILSRPPLRFERGELVFGYRLVRKLGEGSFGAVWLAANEKGFEWALKFVSLQGSGGLKEFKALQLIKDRKINNTNLLKLIDYGLLDHDGNSLATSASPLTEATTPVRRTIETDPGEPQRVTPQGTMLPAAKPSSNLTAVEQLAETQGAATDTKTGDKHRAAWLVIVMEVGQYTLHQLQLQHTERETARTPHRPTRAVTRMGVTAGDSQTIATSTPAVLSDPLEEPLVPLPAATVLPYLEQAARGLDYLHRHDIVHRDIKPQNIILVGDDAKVCDYGLASDSTSSTATTIGCTPAYAAPEAINNRPVPASDQYSLAVTYIELITGRWPFFGVTQTAIYREKDEGRHNLSFITNARSRAALKRALSKLPQDRFSTCTEFIQTLAAAEKSNGRVWSPVQVVGLALAVLLLLLGIFGFAFQGDWWQQKQVAAIPPRPIVPPIEIPANEPDPSPNPMPPGKVLPTQPKIKPEVKPETPPTPIGTPPLLHGDEALTVAFADAKLPPRELLRVLESEVRSAADPTEWFLALRSKAEENPAVFAATEQWLQRNSNRTPPKSLDSSEFRVFEQEFRTASLQRLLNRPLPTTSDLESMLSSPALRLHDSHPLGVLLRIDCELRLADSAPGKDQLEAWNTQIESAHTAELPAKLATLRNQFVVYVDALRLPWRVKQVDVHAEGERLQELLNASPQPAWFIADRKQRLAEPLGQIALLELGKTDRDLLELPRFQLDSNKQLDELLATASHNQLPGKSLAAVQAIKQASQALENPNRPADWSAIGRLASAAFNNSATNAVLDNQQQRRLVFYVMKLAILRTAAPGSDGFRDAVNGFATLLATKQDGVPLYFDFAQETRPSDVGLYRTLLEPVLNQAALANPNSTAADPASLALLAAAQARLVQRTPEIARLIEPASQPNLSADVRTLLVAHRAFERARQWDKQAVAAGKVPAEHLTTAHQQVLATIPKLTADVTRTLPDLLAIIDAFDPTGTATDAELLRIGGYVRRQQAYQEPSLQRRNELVRDASARYEKCLAAATNNPALSAQAANEFADLQLKLAGWTELSGTDYEVSNEQIEPPAGTKSHYLWKAANLARQAIAGAKPEGAEPFVTLAVAHEEMAFALGRIDNYALALAACEQGLRAVPAKSAGVSQLQAGKGRALMRHGSELFSELSLEDRKARLQQAVAELETSLSDRRTTKRWQPHDAENLAALAEAHIGLATDADRAARLTQAEAALRTAIEAADPRAPRLTHYRWRLLQVVSNQEGPSLRPAQQLADEIFVALEKNPADQDPAAVFGIATATAGLYSEPSKLLRWLPAKGPWYDQWRSSDAWKLEAARLYAEASLTGAIPDLKRTAQQLTLELPARSPHRRLAEAYLQDIAARELCRDFERMKPLGSAASEVSQRSYEADRQAKAGIATAAIRDCVQKHWDSQDLRIQALLTEINRASAADLLAGKVLPGASVLEKRALWKYLTTAPSLESREKYLDVYQQQGSQTAASDPNRQQSAQTASELLKPALYFAPLVPQDSRLESLVKRYKSAESEKKK
ncbi:serine/threonine-protein kinase [Anatilimnocola floriformis]|uniref:serine/threonine-protein kinase n=1 Tax=Anatilimnocola floriformis TaxID=2948575 RepID=UPI0020C4964D|nr:protein kinase [Anatilimnocola floriformis]